MALVLKDRVKETTTTIGDGAYTLNGAVTGFQAFSVIGDGNTTYYCCTDGTDFEIGIGTYTASGTTLSRSDQNVFESSNNNNRVDWGAGKKDIFVSQPADKAVFLNDDGDIDFEDTATRIKLESNAGNSGSGDPSISIAGGGPNYIRFHDGTDFTSTTNAVDITYRTTPNDLIIERASGENIAEFGGDDGHAALYFNDSKKLETVTGGVDVTGAITVSGHLEPVAGTTYTPPSGDGSDTSTDVALALRREDQIVIGHNGYIRRMLHATSSGDIHVGHSSATSFIGNVKIYPGSGGSTEIYHKGTNLKIDTTDAGIDVTGTVTDDGATHDGDVTFTGANYNIVFDKSDDALEFADNAKATFGTDTDLQIYHDGSNSFITEGGTGDLYIRNDNGLVIQNAAGSEDKAKFASNGAVELYYDNNLRLTTTTDGVTVTGGAGDATLTIEADTDNSDENDNAALVLSQDGGSTVSRLRLGSGNATVLEAHSNGALILQSTSGDDFLVGNQNAGVELFYDGSERLTTASSGIVTTSPALTNQGTYTNGVARALFTHTVVGNNPSNIQYVKIATLPATGDGTLDHLTIEGQVGGWTLTTAGFFKITFSRRNGFSYFYDAHSDIQTLAAVQAYQQSDGTVQIWGKLNASSYSKLSYSIPHSFQVTIEENPSLTTTAPSGTLAFDSSSSTYAPRFQVDDAGNLSATTKSFDIAHPTKENMRLRYGSLEGPENGVYVRGRLTGSSVIELPEHWAGLVDEDSITVQLTAIGKSQDLWVEEVSIEQVKVCDANTDCFYMVMAERIDVAKLEVEYAN